MPRASLAGELSEPWPKICLAKGDAGKIEFAKLFGPCIGVDERCSVEEKRQRRSAAFAQLGALDMDGRGKNDAGVDVGNVRRRKYPRQTGLVAPHIARPVLHFDDLKVAANAEMLIEHFCELADRHTVPCRIAYWPTNDLNASSVIVALDIVSVDRIWTVADDDSLAIFCGRAHAAGHRVYERVDAASDVLQIDDERIDVRNHFLGRLADLAVERIDHDAGPRIADVRSLDHVVLNVPADAVLRTEKRRQVDFGMFVKYVRRMLKRVRQNRRLVADETDALPAEEMIFSLKKTSMPSEFVDYCIFTYRIKSVSADFRNIASMRKFHLNTEFATCQE